MTKPALLSLLFLFGASGVACAQTPATNPMPDGSRDMYLGLGLSSQPRYEGAGERRTRLLPVLQVQWGSGVFVAGQSLGMHLSERPDLEYGPLLALDLGRNASTLSGIGINNGAATALPGNSMPLAQLTRDRLAGVDEVPARLQAGGFFNAYLTPELRLANSLLAGEGRERRGLRWTVDLQHLAVAVAPHHSLAAGVGFSWANRSAEQTLFGVSADEAARSINHAYAASAGVENLHAQLRWNWTLDTRWLLTSTLSAQRINANADSPLVERRNALGASSALAYRF